MIFQAVGTYYQMFVHRVVHSQEPHKSAVTHSEQYLAYSWLKDVWRKHGNYEGRELEKEKDDDRNSGYIKQREIHNLPQM